MLKKIMIKKCPICGCTEIATEHWNKVGFDQDEIRQFECGLEVAWDTRGNEFELSRPCGKQDEFVLNLVLGQADNDSGSHIIKDIDLYVLGQDLLRVYLLLNKELPKGSELRFAFMGNWAYVEHSHRKLGGTVEINR